MWSVSINGLLLLTGSQTDSRIVYRLWFVTELVTLHVSGLHHLGVGSSIWSGRLFTTNRVCQGPTLLFVLTRSNILKVLTTGSRPEVRETNRQIGRSLHVSFAVWFLRSLVSRDPRESGNVVMELILRSRVIRRVFTPSLVVLVGSDKK